MNRVDAREPKPESARGLPRAIVYGSGEQQFVEVSVGLDAGEAFIGNAGERRRASGQTTYHVATTAVKSYSAPLLL